jgi:hypothetical protein
LEWSIPGINGDWFTAISEAQASGQATPELIAQISEAHATHFV